MNKQRGYFQSSDMSNEHKLKIATSACNVNVAFVKIRAIDHLETIKAKFDGFFFMNVQWAVLTTITHELTLERTIEVFDYFKLDPATKRLDDLAYEIAKIIMVDIGERSK